ERICCHFQKQRLEYSITLTFKSQHFRERVFFNIKAKFMTNFYVGNRLYHYTFTMSTNILLFPKDFLIKYDSVFKTAKYILLLIN
ncbi:hypothetical protein, partial [Virgibacillus halodenitrificans]|uniref:hypothetical protein n=1 Tax=Virgibacillus halodenitrificans TaxID=1482 RepID=UPI000A3FDB69